MGFVVPAGLPGAGRTLRSAFIVGAPRCGTTFLAKCLARHPRICSSKPKETHFFVRVAPGMPPDRVPRELLRRHFGALSDAHQLIVEGSPSCLYDPDSVPRILAFDPEARLVVAVRNPIDMVYSHHARMLYTLNEDLSDFGRAWALQPDRARGLRLPQRCNEPLLLQYREVGTLAARVERLFETVGRDRCHVVVYDDLAADPVKVYRNLLEFLGVEDDGRTKFGSRNENREFRSPWLQQFVMNPPWPIMPLLVVWERKGFVRPRAVRAVRRYIKKRNTRPAARPSLSSDLREELRLAFAPDVARLGELLGRDLSHWR